MNVENKAESKDSEQGILQTAKKRREGTVGWKQQSRRKEEEEDPIASKLTNNALGPKDDIDYAPKATGSYYLQLRQADVNSLFASPLELETSSADSYHLSLRLLYDTVLYQVSWTQ